MSVELSNKIFNEFVKYYLKNIKSYIKDISHDDVVRKILRVSQTHVICECGRRFLINDNLIIETIG